MGTDEIAVKLAEIDQRSRSNTHRISEIAGKIDALNKLAVSVERLVLENQHQTETIREIRTDVAGLGEKVDAIEKKPAKKWDNLAEKVLWAFVAAAIAFILARVGVA